MVFGDFGVVSGMSLGLKEQSYDFSSSLDVWCLKNALTFSETHFPHPKMAVIVSALYVGQPCMILGISMKPSQETVP